MTNSEPGPAFFLSCLKECAFVFILLSAKGRYASLFVGSMFYSRTTTGISSKLVSLNWLPHVAAKVASARAEAPGCKISTWSPPSDSFA
jgi:hypothetical protein